MSSDYQLEDTIFLPFTTRAFATGIPTVLAGTPLIDIYEDASTTQIITGETLVVDFDSVVGLNMVTVTATNATGFEAGKSYTVIIEQGTVDSVSVVGEVIAHFTLDMSAAAKDLANATDGLGAIKADSAAILIDTAVIGALGVGLTDLGGMSTSMKAEVNTEADLALTDVNLDHLVGTASGIPAIPAGTYIDLMQDDGTAVYARSTDSLQAIRDHAATIKAETVLILADTADMQPKLGSPAGTDISADLVAIKGDTATILVDTADMQPKLGSPAVDISADLLVIDINVDTILVDTADMQPKLGSPAVDISADLLVIDTNVDNILIDTNALNDTKIPDTISLANIKTQTVTALTDINLDHMVKIAVDTDFATTVHLDSVIGQMSDPGTSATFTRTTDSLESIRNKLTDIETDTQAIETDTQDIQARLPAALSSGNMKSDLLAITGGDTAADNLKAFTDGTGYVGGTAKLTVDLTKVNGDATAAANLEASTEVIVRATVDTDTNSHTPTTTEFQCDNITEATADHFNGRIVIFRTGVLVNQATDITSYELVGGIGQFTVTALTEAPSNNDTLVIV